MPDNTLILYHANCPDGFGAAWSFYKKYGSTAKYIPVTHGEEPPDVRGCNVFIVDFSYDRVTMEGMAQRAESLIVLDHHKSAKEQCDDLEFCHFDMDHSGAYLAWQYLFGDNDVPLIIQYVEDRDLWKWELQDTEQILSAVDAFDKTFESWDMLSTFLDKPDSLKWNKVRSMGEGILQYKNNLIKSLLQHSHFLTILGEEIPAINAPFFQSEMASELAVNAPYAAAYYFDGSGYRFSLRSRGGGVDVSAVASRFGGGGHATASGFTIARLSELNKKVE